MKNPKEIMLELLDIVYDIKRDNDCTKPPTDATDLDDEKCAFCGYRIDCIRINIHKERCEELYKEVQNGSIYKVNVPPKNELTSLLTKKHH